MRLAFAMTAVAAWLAPALHAGEVPFTDPAWEFQADTAEVVTIDGREALHLMGGRATLDADFRDGVIEYDLMVTAERGFHGIEFRGDGNRSAERFYIRPHQSGNPDANQYTPVFHGLAGWQLYHGPRFSAPTAYRSGEWMHHRIVVSGGRADVYIDGDKPVLHVADLKNRNEPGTLALFSGNAPAHFAAFRVEMRDAPEIAGSSEPGPAPAPGTIGHWDVSSPFDEETLAGVTRLEPEHVARLTWQPLLVEDRGYANLARVAAFGDGADTVFARLRLEADATMTRMLELGYSDRVRVYLNGALLYAGDNGYRTRDYRYLGTIGLFDALPLRLQAGTNELLFAVSESFGGWGIMARIENRDGLALGRSVDPAGSY